jgi:hypothetical protein
LGKITSIENSYSYLYLIQNMEKEGLLGVVTPKDFNPKGYVKRAGQNGKSFRAVFIDLHGTDEFESDEPIPVDKIHQDLVEVIRDSTKVSPLVSYRVPRNTSDESLFVLGDQLRRGTYIHTHTIEGQEQFATRTVYHPVNQSITDTKNFILPTKTSIWTPIN